MECSTKLLKSEKLDFQRENENSIALMSNFILPLLENLMGESNAHSSAAIGRTPLEGTHNAAHWAKDKTGVHHTAKIRQADRASRWNVAISRYTLKGFSCSSKPGRDSRGDFDLSLLYDGLLLTA